MKTAEKVCMLNEIKEIERELYQKRSRLSAREILDETPVTLPLLVAPDVFDPKEWDKVFKALMSKIGESSSGGNAVDDISLERSR
jgi:hypothetical protein